MTDSKNPAQKPDWEWKPARLGFSKRSYLPCKIMLEAAGQRKLASQINWFSRKNANSGGQWLAEMRCLMLHSGISTGIDLAYWEVFNALFLGGVITDPRIVKILSPHPIIGKIKIDIVADKRPVLPLHTEDLFIALALRWIAAAMRQINRYSQADVAASFTTQQTNISLLENLQHGFSMDNVLFYIADLFGIAPPDALLCARYLTAPDGFGKLTAAKTYRGEQYAEKLDIILHWAMTAPRKYVDSLAIVRGETPSETIQRLAEYRKHKWLKDNG